jgi:hypothetical protein
MNKAANAFLGVTAILTGLTTTVPAYADITRNDVENEVESLYQRAGEECAPIVEAVFSGADAATVEDHLVPCADVQMDYARLISDYYSQNNQFSNRVDFDRACPQVMSNYDAQVEGFEPTTLAQKQAIADFSAQSAYNCAYVMDVHVSSPISPFDINAQRNIIGAMFCSAAIGLQDVNPGRAAAEERGCKEVSPNFPLAGGLQLRRN